MEDEYDVKREMEKRIEQLQRKNEAYEKKLGNYNVMVMCGGYIISL